MNTYHTQLEMENLKKLCSLFKLLFSEKNRWKNTHDIHILFRPGDYSHQKNQVLRNAFIAKPKCYPSSHTYVHTTLMFKKQFSFSQQNIN